MSSYGFKGRKSICCDTSENVGICLPVLQHFEQFSTDLKLSTLYIDNVAISL